MISLTDITSGISWTDDSKYFFTPKSVEHVLLAELLSHHTINSITDEIILLEEAIQVFNTNDTNQIDSYIMNRRMGYTEEGMYAYIAGSMDFSVGIFWDKDNRLFLKHANGNFSETETVNLLDLSALLNETCQIL